MTPRPRRSSIGTRLVLAQAVVLITGVATTAVIAAIIGPPLFREHLHRAGVPANSMEEMHAEEAYTYATVFSVGGALAVSALTAIALFWYLSRRLQKSVTEVASAARAVADGNYDIRVAPPELGDDFDALAGAFNQMASRLQTVDTTRRQLFSDLAHEIRTPVSVLDAYIEALEDGVRTLTPDTTAMLRHQTRRLVRFSEDVSALTQAEESPASMAYSWIEVATLIDTAETTARDRYRAKRVELTTVTAPGLPRLWGDPQRLAQVLGNLLDNALRHTPAGGRVEMRATAVQSGIRLTVSDSGEGIAAEDLPRIFERFFRAGAARDRENGGAGIGLAIVKALVQAHGGTITAASRGAGQGAEFTLTLPAPEPV
ncbi:HAMP domain-containing sensor histidine kinase [soil metagenome]